MLPSVAAGLHASTLIQSSGCLRSSMMHCITASALPTPIPPTSGPDLPTLCLASLPLQGQVVKAVIVETKKEVQRKDGRWAGQQGGRIMRGEQMCGTASAGAAMLNRPRRRAAGSVPGLLPINHAAGPSRCPAAPPKLVSPTRPATA